LVGTENWALAYDQLLAIMQTASDKNDVSGSLLLILEVLLPDSQHVYLAWLLCAFVPWARAVPEASKKPKAKAPPTVAATVAREGIKANNSETKIVENAVITLPDIVTTREVIKDQEDATTSPLKRKKYSALREAQGMAIRRWGVNWRSSVMYTFLVEVMETGEANGMSRIYPLCVTKLIFEDRQQLVDSYAKWLSRIKELDLLDAPSLKPMVDGKQLCDALEAQNGPWVKKALDSLIEWQLQNPDETDTDRAIEEVKRRKKEFGPF
jgi:tRNA nucleotidyltransferase (CCA-adding enzyme)